MKRRDFLKVTGIGAAGAATLAAPAIAQSMPEIKWRMPASWPKSLDTLYGGAEMMAKAVGEATDNKFQIQTFAGGEIVPACRFSTPCKTAPSRSGTPHPIITSARTRPSPSARRCRSVPTCASTRPGTCWAAAGAAQRASTRSYNVISLLAGNTGCQMGGWFRKEINTVDDLKGLKFASAASPGASAEAGRRAAADRRRRHLSGAGKRHDRRGGMGRTLRRREARLLQGRAALLLSRAGGKAVRCCSAFVNLDKWNALPKYYQSVLEQAGHYANNWMMAKYDQANPPALKRLLADGTKLHAFSPPIMQACLKAAKELHNEVVGDQCGLQEGLESHDCLLEQRLSVVPGRGSRLRQLHGASRAELIASGHASTKPRSRAPGFFHATEVQLRRAK